MFDRCRCKGGMLPPGNQHVKLCVPTRCGPHHNVDCGWPRLEHARKAGSAGEGTGNDGWQWLSSCSTYFAVAKTARRGSVQPAVPADVMVRWCPPMPAIVGPLATRHPGCWSPYSRPLPLQMAESPSPHGRPRRCPWQNHRRRRVGRCCCWRQNHGRRTVGRCRCKWQNHRRRTVGHAAAHGRITVAVESAAAVAGGRITVA
eukprot:349704-Chlamydomonas_euryale.AAC.10